MLAASRALVDHLNETISNPGLFEHQNASSNTMIEGPILCKLHTKQFLLQFL